MFDFAVTPSSVPFYRLHREAFDAWRKEGQGASVQPTLPPSRPIRSTSQRPKLAGQLDLLDFPRRWP